jgi:putative transposase
LSTKYKFGEKTGAYFVSFATVNWIDVFTRDAYFWNIIESLDFCTKNKGMEIYGYCIMPSHVHLIFRSVNGDPSGLMRDFKGFTSKKMLKTIEENTQDPSLKGELAKQSRKEWLLWMMERAGKKNSNVKHRQFWQQDNHPIEIWSLRVFEQKLNYIHQNPIAVEIPRFFCVD